MKRGHLEQLIGIVGLIVVGAGIFAHSISLDGDVKILSKKNDITVSAIKEIRDTITNLKSDFGAINTKIDNNKEIIQSLSDKVEKTQDHLFSSIEKTHKLLVRLYGNDQ